MSMLRIVSYVYPEYIIKGIRYLNRLLRSAYYQRKLNGGKGFYISSVRSIKGYDNISIGNKFMTGKNLKIEAWTSFQGKIFIPKIVFGNNVLLGDDNHIGAINEIIIGDNLLTGSNVYITDHHHGKSNYEDCLLPPVERELYSRGPVHIGNNVWLGNNVVVMPNVTIGDGVVVGANSVVTKSIPDYCVAAGIPAKVIRTNKVEK